MLELPDLKILLYESHLRDDFDIIVMAVVQSSTMLFRILKYTIESSPGDSDLKKSLKLLLYWDLIDEQMTQSKVLISRKNLKNGRKQFASSDMTVD